MPILPIDLQTMFSNMNQVSKDQSVQKEEASAQQSLAGLQQVKKAEENDNSVNETREIGDGVDKISEEEKKKNEKAKKKRGKKNKSDLQDMDAKEVVKDPLLGHHVDISG
jgi:hypothetical protein